MPSGVALRTITTLGRRWLSPREPGRRRRRPALWMRRDEVIDHGEWAIAPDGCQQERLIDEVTLCITPADRSGPRTSRSERSSRRFEPGSAELGEAFEQERFDPVRFFRAVRANDRLDRIGPTTK